MNLENIETMDASDVDMKARDLLVGELTASGITCAVAIWPDKGRAYLDADEDVYDALRAHFNKQHLETVGVPTASFSQYDKNLLDDALYNRYLVLVDEVQQELEKQTQQSEDINTKSGEVRVVSWRRPDGWYACLVGTNDGNYFESEDQGPYDDRSEAKEAALEGAE